MFVALAVMRGEQLFRQAPRGAEGGIEGFAAMFGEARALGQGFGIEDFVQLERQVAGTEQGFGHDDLGERGSWGGAAKASTVAGGARVPASLGW